ncbi:MAG: sugar phosphate isomerase/epimerase [Nanoarchaeota archaeon]|nr:sugar phosphate isomerase/epimerase [Nanoarchaeota archaeon]
MVNYKIDNIYQGGYSSLNPSYGSVFTGYHASSGELGAPTKPDTANQIQQVNQLLNQGIIPIEVGALQPEVFDQIPKQHFKEINRMAKLTGAKISLHAPLIEPSGIDPEQRRPWDESYRELAERQLTDAVERSLDMSDKERIPITIHGSNIPGSEFKMIHKKEGDKGERVMDRLIVINRETGKMAPLEEEKKHYPESADIDKERIRDPMKLLCDLNESEWDNSISQIMFYKEGADRILSETPPIARKLYLGLITGEIKPSDLSPEQGDVLMRVQNADEYLKHTQMSIRGLFDRAYKYGTEEEKKQLSQIAKAYKTQLGIQNNGKQDIEKLDLQNQARATNILIGGLRTVKPNLYIPIEDFAIENSAKTFANVAFNAYEFAKKNKKPLPMINVENMFPGMAFSSGEKMDQLIIKSKNKFVEKAVREGVSESEAKKKADEIIGVTLDVGHLNIYKKKGFEDKDLLKEIDAIKKYVKHVHLTDNFGYSDSHLPPGMGNVPIKEILEKLEKEGVDARKIVEAGGFVQHFGISPFPYVLEGLGSPIYTDGVSPFWNQVSGLYQGYFGGQGLTLPQINYETFGAGFAQLPIELGGQRPGAQGSRMSGKGME